MSVGTRQDSEHALARALSRHIGYTSAAYSLPRILSVLDFFHDKASGYKQEVLAYLKAAALEEGSKEGSDKYLEEVMNFAVAMRLVEVVTTREAALPRLAPTDIGRSVLGALACGDEEFARYYITRTVLLADADFLYPILQHYLDRNQEGLKEYFISFQMKLRERRLQWLAEAVPESILRSRIAENVSWMLRPRNRLQDYIADHPTMNTARHHTTPRQGWLQYLGMIDAGKKHLTDFGRDVATALAPSGSYFWLGPVSDVQNALRIPLDKQERIGPFEDTLSLSPHEQLLEPTSDDVSKLVDRLAEIMDRAYGAAKLIHAPQASLIISIEFIRYASYREGKDYRWEVLLNEFFHLKKTQFERFSAKKGQIGFYRPKKSRIDS